MKTLVLFTLIMASLSFKLNAFDLNSPELKNIEDLIKKTKGEHNKSDPKSNPYYRLVREEELRNDRSCPHCPKYLLLTEEVNKIVDKMGKDPKVIESADELPMKLSNLKFMFYEQALREHNGKVECRRFQDFTPDLKPTKFDGQFKLLAEDALKFSAVTDILYMNPLAEETVYYYRGEGAEKNMIVQAILTKQGGKLRYYRYIPSEKEENPYNLPELGKTTPPKYEPRPADNYVAKDAVTSPGSSGGAGTPKLGNNNYSLTFKTEVEKRNKFIPKNVHFAEAKVEHDLLGDLKLKANSDVSLTGNKARLSLKRENNQDLVQIELDTKLNGKTDHKITVPFSLRTLDVLPTVNGKMEASSNGEVLNLSLVDQGIDLVRSEFRRNGNTGATSYVLARDVKLDKNEVLSMQYGRGEDNRQYASIKHVKTIKDNITLVLDIKVDQDRKASLFYQVSAKF